MSRDTIREGAKAPDPVLALIAKHKAIGQKIDGWKYKRTKASEAAFKTLEARFDPALDKIETTAPTTAEGIAASIRYYRELKSKLFVLDDETWLGTLAQAADGLGPKPSRRAHREGAPSGAPDPSPRSLLPDLYDGPLFQLDRGILALDELALMSVEAGSTADGEKLAKAVLWIAERQRELFDQAKAIIVTAIRA